MSRTLYQFKDYLIDKYGKPLYRIPINLAFGCPHKNKNSEGCIFCSEDGARARHLSRHLDIESQVESGVNYVKRRYHATAPFIAYFQTYTNTNAPLNVIKSYYEQVLKLADFKIIIVSTRPDCLPYDVLNYFEELNSRYDLWVELGVQTTNDKTLNIINRGHDFRATQVAALKLSALKVKTAAHIIIGLPGENRNDFINTVNKISSLPFSGIKIHNLLVLKKSPLARLYNETNIRNLYLLNEYEYAAILIDLIRRIPASWPLMRINADADIKEIIAPKWTMSKGQFIILVKNSMIQNGFYQGEFFNNKPKLNNLSANSADSISSSYFKIKTDDGSYTFHDPKFNENYHSIAGASSEAEKKFIEPSSLKNMLYSKQNIHILDIGFGLGYNAIAAIKCALTCNKSLKITSLELNTTPLKLSKGLYSDESMEFQLLDSLLKTGLWVSGNIEINLIIGDARNSIKTLNDKFDIVFMDGFSPAKNPELWSYDFIRYISGVLLLNGVILTYSAAFPLRGALLRAGFNIGITEPFGRRKGGTIASNNYENIILPISDKDKNIILKSTAGTAYRDPYLNWSPKKILHFRDKLLKRLKASGIPKWYKS